MNEEWLKSLLQVRNGHKFLVFKRVSFASKHTPEELREYQIERTNSPVGNPKEIESWLKEKGANRYLDGFILKEQSGTERMVLI